MKRKQSHLTGESHIKQKVVINVVSSGLLYGIVVFIETLKYLKASSNAKMYLGICLRGYPLVCT